MNSSAVSRPPRVTTACLFVGLSCLFALVNVGATLATWGSTGTQDQIRAIMASGFFKSSGLAAADVMGWFRWGLMGIAAVATAGVVFAIYTALGHQASRVILTVICALASLVFLAGGLFGIVPAAFSIGCGIYLWTSEAGQWFAIKNGKMSAPAGAPIVDPFAVPLPLDDTAVAAKAADPALVRSASRPRSVFIAGVVALVGSVTAAALSGLFLVVYLTAHDAIVRAEMTSPSMKWFHLTNADVARGLDSTAQFCALAVMLSVPAIIAAVLLLNGSLLGRRVTIALSIAAVPVGVFSLVGLPWSAAAVATIVLLRRPESREFFVGSR